MSDLVFVDTETTGLHPEHHHIWEFAGIRRAEDGSETTMLLQVEVNLEQADPFALNVGKFWDRYGKNGVWLDNPAVEAGWSGSLFWSSQIPTRGELVSPMVAAGLIQTFTHGAHLIGNCVSFDAERMARLLYSESLLPTWHYHVIDIEPILVGYAKAKGQDFPLPYSSSEVSKWTGVEEPGEGERHTALGDARWVQRQWDAIFG
jgi:hypothetical protein